MKHKQHSFHSKIHPITNHFTQSKSHWIFTKLRQNFWKLLSITTLTFSLNTLSLSNSVLAIVNDVVITFEIIDQTKSEQQKMSILNQHIDLILQNEKIQTLGIKPKIKNIEAILNDIAVQNGLTLVQLRNNHQFAQIVENIVQNLSLIALKKTILQQANISVSQAEINKILAKSNQNTDSNTKKHKANIKKQLIHAKQTKYFNHWVKGLRNDAYIEIFKDKLKSLK